MVQVLKKRAGSWAVGCATCTGVSAVHRDLSWPVTLPWSPPATPDLCMRLRKENFPSIMFSYPMGPCDFTAGPQQPSSKGYKQ
jgi:hypothetical protein